MNKKGFTIIELLIVIAIIGILAAIAIPGYIGMKERILVTNIIEKKELTKKQRETYLKNKKYYDEKIIAMREDKKIEQKTEEQSAPAPKQKPAVQNPTPINVEGLEKENHSKGKIIISPIPPIE